MSNENTIDFGPLGSFEIAPDLTLSQLISRIENGIGSSDQATQYAAREAATTLRQRLHRIHPEQV